jgi:uncharacterized protein YbaR (Trm112 family)
MATRAENGGASPPLNCYIKGEGAPTTIGDLAMTEQDPALPAAPPGPSEPTRVDPRLLEILVCPLTRATLSYDAERQELISRAAKLAYPIRDGIPIMLPEEARRLEG